LLLTKLQRSSTALGAALDEIIQYIERNSRQPKQRVQHSGTRKR
jgi:hypothetical protein